MGATFVLRRRRRRSSATDNSIAFAVGYCLSYRCREVEAHVRHVRSIRMSSLQDLFYGMGDFEFLSNFSINKTDLLLMVKAIIWPPNRHSTVRKSYKTSSELT